MYIKKLFILSLVLAIVLLTITSCNSSETNSPPASAGTSAEEAAPIELELSLSQPPKLGETAELTLIARIHYFPYPENLVNTRAWVEFSYANTKGSYSEAKYAVPIPLDEVLVDGELSWEGNAENNSDIELLHSTIRLPREGVWRITAYFSGEDLGETYYTRKQIAVTEDFAAFWGTKDFKSGPLGYLANFDYGMLGKMVPDELYPVVLELDISKVPRVGEEVIVTCRIDSIIDWADYSAEFSFARRPGEYPILEVPADTLLVDGDLSWEGDLKKGEPVEFSATVKFPEDGDWMIDVLGENPPPTGLLFSDVIKMNINGEIGSFGWGEFPEEQQGFGNWVWVLVGIAAALLVAGFVVWRLMTRK